MALDQRTKDVLSQLGKQAAAADYQQSFILPPKKVTARSRTLKIRQGGKPAVSVTPDARTSPQAQDPHRYGRLLQRQRERRVELD